MNPERRRGRGPMKSWRRSRWMPSPSSARISPPLGSTTMLSGPSFGPAHLVVVDEHDLPVTLEDGSAVGVGGRGLSALEQAETGLGGDLVGEARGRDSTPAGSDTSAPYPVDRRVIAAAPGAAIASTLPATAMPKAPATLAWIALRRDRRSGTYLACRGIQTASDAASSQVRGCLGLAVAVGFEPTVGVTPHNISSVAPSAARTRHRAEPYRRAGASKKPAAGPTSWADAVVRERPRR